MEEGVKDGYRLLVEAKLRGILSDMEVLGVDFSSTAKKLEEGKAKYEKAVRESDSFESFYSSNEALCVDMVKNSHVIKILSEDMGHLAKKVGLLLQIVPDFEYEDQRLLLECKAANDDKLWLHYIVLEGKVTENANRESVESVYKEIDDAAKNNKEQFQRTHRTQWNIIKST